MTKIKTLAIIKLSNEDFKKISQSKGFKGTNHGLGFCIEISIEEPIFSKKKKAQFQEELKDTTEYINTLVEWLETRITNEHDSFKCAICGYDEFGIAHVSGSYYSYIIDYKDEEKKKIRYCKKCRHPQLINLETTL